MKATCCQSGQPHPAQSPFLRSAVRASRATATHALPPAGAGGSLQPGWTVTVRTRSVLLHGKERQQKDAFYFSPAGDKFASRKKIAITMGLMDASDTTCAAARTAPLRVASFLPARLRMDGAAVLFVL